MTLYSVLARMLGLMRPPPPRDWRKVQRLDDHLTPEQRTRRMLTDLSRPHSICPDCGRVSYLLDDVIHGFCVACDHFHNGVTREMRDRACELKYQKRKEV